MGEVLEDGLEKCVECGKVKDPELRMWLPAEVYFKDVPYRSSYCPQHRKGHYLTAKTDERPVEYQKNHN